MLDVLGIGEAIVDSLRTLALNIFEVLLKGITALYTLFMGIVGWHDFVETPEIQQIFTRIGLILGLFMVFKLTFSAIEYLINPDTMTDKEKGLGNIVKKVLIMIILLGSVRFLFDEAYEIQEKLLDDTDNILYKLIFGEQSQDSSDASEMVWSIFDSYYKLDEKACLGSENAALTEAICETEFNKTLHGNIKDGKFEYAYKYFYEKGKVTEDNNTTEKYIITFDWLFAIFTAGFVLYILIVYVIQLGVRVFQLAYLEIIAPIPIMMYLTPKGDETLKKWGQQCLTTFLDAFIRMAILYFIILVMGIISKADVFSGGISLGIVLMLGLFMFAKKVPDLLGELFPSMGGKAGLGFGFSMPKEAKQLGLFGAGAVLGTAGAATSNLLHGVNATRNAWKESKGLKTKDRLKALGKGIGGTGLSVVGGAVSGFHHGARIKNLKGVGSTIKTTNENREKRDLKQAAGYRVGDAVGDKVKGFAGDTTVAEQKIKTAQFRQQALQSSQAIQWENFAESNKDDQTVDLSLLRSMQEFEENGKKVWRGIDKNGNERKFTYTPAAPATATTKATPETFTALDGLDDIKVGVDMVKNSAIIDKKVKEQGKIIKGLEAAKNDAEK